MYIGIDIGGTNIKGVLLDGKKVIDKTKTPTRSKSSRKIIVAQIFNCINRLVDGRKGIKGIGIGVAGPVDFKNQRILNPPNVTGLRNLYLGKMVQNKFNIKTIIDNDVHCLVLAEAILGAGKGKKTIIGLGLGTGVGGGIVFNGKIFHGTNGTAAEIGHMIILWGDRQCRCGNKGCLEAYINEKGIRITASKIFGRKIDSITLYEMARKKDKKAIKVWEVTGQYLGIGLANIVNIFNPDIIVVGGGISGVNEFLLGPARKEMKKNLLSLLAKDTRVVRVRLGESAGAIGAALL